MPRSLVGDDPMPASSGIGSPFIGGSPELSLASDAARDARRAEADGFFGRRRDPEAMALLNGERTENDQPSDVVAPATPNDGPREIAEDPPTPSELLAAWHRDCERARVVDAYVRRDVIARERAESNRARSTSAHRHRDVARDREARHRADLERVATWQKEHPDRARATKDRWVANNLEKRRRASRDYYHRNKEAILAKANERHQADPSVRQKRQQKYRQSHPDRIAATNAAWRSDPENKKRHDEATRRWERRERRRRAVGLPPRRIHRRAPADKQADARTADDFFGRDWSHTRIPEGPEHWLDPTPPELLDVWEADSSRARLRHRLRDDPEYRERVDRRRTAVLDRIRAQEQRAAAQARIDAIGRAVNDHLRIAGPRCRAGSVDPAAPHQLPSVPARSGLGR